MGWNITCVTPDYAFQDYYSRAISIKTRLPVLTPVFCLCLFFFPSRFVVFTGVWHNKHVIFNITRARFALLCFYKVVVYSRSERSEATARHVHSQLDMKKAHWYVQLHSMMTIFWDRLFWLDDWQGFCNQGPRSADAVQGLRAVSRPASF